MAVQASEKDKELLRLAASFVNLRTRDFEELTGRSNRSVRYRMPKLVISHKHRFGEKKGTERQGVGYFYWLPNPQNPFEKVYFLTQKGWDRAYRLGFISQEVNANQEKSDGQLEHDLVLTDFHKSLHFAFGDRLNWNQLWANRYTRWSKKKDDYVNADACFSFKRSDGSYAFFFVEVENQKGVQEPLRKMDGYLRFAKSGEFQKKFETDDFYVVFLKPTRDMVLNVLGVLDREHQSSKFWFANYTDALIPLAKVFTTGNGKQLSLADA